MRWREVLTDDRRGGCFAAGEVLVDRQTTGQAISRSTVGHGSANTTRERRVPDMPGCVRERERGWVRESMGEM